MNPEVADTLHVARILVVDDVRANVILLEAALTDLAYEVVSADSGEQALERAVKDKPDLILLDIMMPGMSGIEVCQHLKAVPELAAIPVLLLSEVDREEYIVQGLDAGAQD